MDVKEIRLNNLLALASRYDQDIEFCKRIEMNPSYLPQLKGKTKTIGDKIARKVEEKLGLPHGYMDVTHAPSELAPKPPEADVMATAYAIEALPKPLSDQLKRLTFQMLTYCNQEQGEADGATSSSVEPFEVVFNAEQEQTNDRAQVSNLAAK
jgi:hypothetical protein